MSRFLKGNYPLDNTAGDAAPDAAEAKPADVVDQFERRALERLGGSIAFVMKRNTFVWKGGTSEAGETEPKG